MQPTWTILYPMPNPAWDYETIERWLRLGFSAPSWDATSRVVQDELHNIVKRVMPDDVVNVFVTDTLGPAIAAVMCGAEVRICIDDAAPESVWHEHKCMIQRFVDQPQIVHNWQGVEPLAATWLIRHAGCEVGLWEAMADGVIVIC